MQQPYKRSGIIFPSKILFPLKKFLGFLRDFLSTWLLLWHSLSSPTSSATGLVIQHSQNFIDWWIHLLQCTDPSWTVDSKIYLDFQFWAAPTLWKEPINQPENSALFFWFPDLINLCVCVNLPSKASPGLSQLSLHISVEMFSKQTGSGVEELWEAIHLSRTNCPYVRSLSD